MINNHNIGAVAQFTNQLLQETDFNVFVEKTLSSLEKVFHADNSVIVDWTRSAWGQTPVSKEDVFFSHISHEVEFDYPKIYEEDPFYKWIFSERCQQDLNVSRLSDLLGFAELKKTAFYREVVHPLRMRYLMVMVVQDKQKPLFSISMTRTPEKNNFTRSDVNLAQLVTPILSNAVNHLLLSTRSEIKDGVFDIISGMHQQDAIIIFDANMKSVYRTDAMIRIGERLRQHGDTIHDIFNKSPAIKKYVTLFYSELRADHLRLPESLSDLIPITSCWSISVEVKAFIYSPKKRYLLVKLATDKDQSSINNLQAEYGLTMRECQIAQFVSRGLNSFEIGKELAISHWSVKNHLKNIYAKVGVNNRVGLTQLISHT